MIKKNTIPFVNTIHVDEVPFGSHILKVDIINDIITYWYLENENDYELGANTWYVARTNEELPDLAKFFYINTLTDSVNQEYHVFLK